METNNFPQDWSVSPLRDLTLKFLNGGTPSTANPQYWDGDIPWITGADAENFVTVTARKSVTAKGIRESSTNVVPRSNILLVTRTGVGKVSIAGVDVAISQDLTGLIVNPDLVDAKFLCRQLLRLTPTLKRFAQGTIIEGIERTEVERLQIPIPATVKEQHHIANILDTVDEAIRQTEAFIAKLKQIKAGLLHDLLTCGVDENGELRDPVAHPDQFQRTSLGLFPKNWEITTLGNVITRSGGFIQTGPFGSQLHSHEYTPEGTPVIMPDDMIDGKIDPQEIRRIPGSKANILSRHKVKQNDVVFARRGDLSRCFAVTDGELDWLCGTGCLLVRVPEKEIVGYWLALLYGHDMIQRQVLARAVGSTMVNLNSKIIAGLAIGKPKTDEQKTIVKILDEQNAQIQTEKCYLSKLHQLKQGLMQDLLTGSVRVNEINFDLPEA